MHVRRIIPIAGLITAIFLVAPRQDVARAQTAADCSTSGPHLFQPPAEDCSQPKPIFVQPDGMWIQPATPVEVVPILPLPQTAGPSPEVLPPPMFNAPAPAPAPEGPLTNIAPGGAISPQFGLPTPSESPPAFANPILVPAADDQLTWEQVTDVVSDYFRIAREQQVRRSGEAWGD